MRKSILTILFIAFCFSSFSQLDLPKFKDTTDKVLFPQDSLLSKIPSKSKVAIIFTRYSAWTIYKEYKIISYQNDNKWHYNILVHPGTEYLLFEIATPQKSIEKVWESAKLNNLFSITKEKLNDTNCDSNIFDSHYYLFWIVIGDEYRKIRYYSPEYFEKNCQSDSERKEIINFARLFQDFIKKSK